MPLLSDIHTIVFDFDGVFTDNKVWVDQDGRESVRCDRGDGLAFDIMRAFQNQGKIKADYFILSKESNPVVVSRAKKLKILCHYGVQDKVSFMKKYLSSKIMDEIARFGGLIYIGNDLNDLALMNLAGFSVAPKDAHPMVLASADLVLEKAGGEGCVREFIERLLQIDLCTQEEIHEFVSNC